MKHIIVEGPDGAGKTTLIQHLSEHLGVPVHDKASSSIGGPVDYLGKWVDSDMGTLRNPFTQFIYDRHPVISEPIYARLVRKQPAQYPFEVDEFVNGVREVIYDSSVVVWCLPGLDVVMSNVMKNWRDQMPGVVTNIGKLHQAYATAMFRWRGPKRQYDYTRHDLPWFTEQLRGMVQ